MSGGVARRPVVAARRRFLVAAGAAGAGSFAMPQIIAAQTRHWRLQSAWPPRDIFHEFAVDYAAMVDSMSGGRLKFDVRSAGSIVPPFQMADAVHTGILDGAHGLATLRHNKHAACSLFGTPPSFGWDSHSFLAWFYEGGGEALYKELMNGILNLNVVGFLNFPMPTQPLGWFRQEVKSGADFKGLRYRTFGLTAEVFAVLGAAITPLPGGEIVPVMERGLLDAADSNNPSRDVRLGLPDVAKVYMMGGHHLQVGALEIIFNKAKFDALPGELRSILRHAASAASSNQLGHAYARYAMDFADIRRRGVNVMRSSAKLLEDQLKAWDAVIVERSREPFFSKVIASQKAWVKLTGAYLHANNLDSAALSSAYNHFFGQG
jgi:TRAP-type mannitol/chloroaromatic compound transport system substrate-binding protein